MSVAPQLQKIDFSGARLCFDAIGWTSQTACSGEKYHFGIPTEFLSEHHPMRTRTKLQRLHKSRLVENKKPKESVHRPTAGDMTYPQFKFVPC